MDLTRGAGGAGGSVAVASQDLPPELQPRYLALSLSPGPPQALSLSPLPVRLLTRSTELPVLPVLAIADQALELELVLQQGASQASQSSQVC